MSDNLAECSLFLLLHEKFSMLNARHLNWTAVKFNNYNMAANESTQPNKNKIKTLSSMTVAELKKYLQIRGVAVNGYLKPALLEIAQAVEKMMLPVEPIMNNYSNQGSSEDTYLYY